MQAITHPEHAESHATHLREGYFMGCLPAIVTSVNDPKKAGRIKARANLIDDLNDLPNATDGWIPVLTSYVLTDTPGGKISPLQVGSQVVLVPIAGQMDNWLCFGAVHTSAEPPHPSHDLYEGTYGEQTPEGITHVRSGDAAEVKTYPHGVIKGVSATGDVITKTNDTTVTQSAGGVVLLENKASSMNMSPTGTVGIINATGNRIDLSDTGTIAVTSASKSSMVFVDGKVEIAGPPSGNKKVEDYKKSLSKSIGGLNEMFSGLQNIDLSSLSIENITATIGTVNEAIAKGQAVVADYEIAKSQAAQILDDLVKNPAEAIKAISPQASQFLDNNLDKVLPIIRQAATANLGGSDILKQITGFLPKGINTTAADLDRTLSQFRSNPDLAATAAVNQIYGTQARDYESLIGTNVQYSIGSVNAIAFSTAPTYKDSPKEAIALLTQTNALVTTLSDANPIFRATADPKEVAIAIEKLSISDPAYLDEAVAAAWRKYQLDAISKALPNALAGTISEEALDRVIKSETPTIAASTLAVEAQKIELSKAAVANPLLDVGISKVDSASEIIAALDLDDRNQSLVGLISLGQADDFSQVGLLLDRVAAVDLTKPLVRDPIGAFKLAVAGVRDRLNSRFTAEDPVCQSAIQFIFADLDKYIADRVRVFTAQAATDPNWSIDTIALKFQTDALVEGTKKYQASYPDINLFWDDLTAEIKDFTDKQLDIDKQIATRAIATQLKSQNPSKPDDYTSAAVAKSKVIPSDWTPPESFDPVALEDLIDEVSQLRTNISELAINNEGCDDSDTIVRNIIEATISELLAIVRQAETAKQLVPFSSFKTSYDASVSQTTPYQLTAKSRTELLDLYLTTLESLFATERILARDRYLQTLAKQTTTQSRDGRPAEGNQIPYAIALMEYRTMGQRFIANLEDPSIDSSYALSISRILSEFSFVVNDWFRRNSTANSAAELIDLPSLYDLKATVAGFIAVNELTYTPTFPQINLLWDELLLTTDYLMFYPTSQGSTGNNQVTRSAEAVNLPGDYAKSVNPVPEIVSESDWLKATIAIAKSVMTDLSNLYPPFKEYQAIAVQALDVLPTIFPSAKMTLTDGKVDIKASNTGSQVSLGEGIAQMASGGGAAAVKLGGGTADITTGTAGAALNLGAGLGKLSGGAFGGSVLASAGGATLSGPGGICSIGAGAGGLSFSTPWGGFGFGSGGFGLTGDQPVNFAVQEADFNGGTSALYLDARKGVGIRSTEQYSNDVTAEINVFNGVISISCPYNSRANIRLDANGVTIGGVNISNFSTQFNYIFSRLLALEAGGS